MTNLHHQVQWGFTMIELIVTMVLIGILSAVAIPRMNLISGFDDIGYRDQVIATLDFGRKAAVAQRRKVQVTRTGNALSLDIASDIPEGVASSTFDRPLLLPGSNLNQIAPLGSATLDAGPTTLVFGPQGTATATSYTYMVSGQALTVDSGTGYVSY